ncbi:cation transporter [Microbacterium sp. EYE_5]|uniref:heavy-metal-associated domain-containing protein n=1 Tax=unclassified Microbacterium TaxID=2609290 RepID=UPI002006241C|nr:MULTISPECIES: cation transporter [unclassified Microbacterium]MCK6079544.1 cation transporter [Microbacterium sp. EYE_382]MCK6084814.1 cation transporter [Microbacterium sp. EYE_384]MCK6122959.1 cation transporter [Microbacterium sp. EYE_80]MCK6125578.1 cation transporter [Microbacterium sp. EYE_79]MCK6140498.1 cation transporter [Microbacterium sp. EYE_39]
MTERIQLGLTDVSASAQAPASAVNVDILVTGMTCGHCVASVKEELSEVDGVEAVSVELVKGGASRVTVHSATPVDDDAMTAAVEEAGYTRVHA